jgi:predicted GIY-YIG superfamily endonuclease
MVERQLLLFPSPRPLVERLGVEFFRGMPEQPGVYLMCGAKEGVLYVGKAKNLRRRMASYRSANLERLPRKLRRLLVSVERVYWDVCRDENSALIRERELLRVLHPRFNTIGVYPAPEHHFGWQRTRNGLALGIGQVTEGWEQRHGAFPRTKPVYAALLRLAWKAQHPLATPHETPAPLLTDSPPAVWLLLEPHHGHGAELAELAQRLEGFLRGQSPELPEWLLSFGRGASRFEDQWREEDALCLREFYIRLISTQEKGESMDE